MELVCTITGLIAIALGCLVLVRLEREPNLHDHAVLDVTEEAGLIYGKPAFARIGDGEVHVIELLRLIGRLSKLQHDAFVSGDPHAWNRATSKKNELLVKLESRVRVWGVALEHP